MRFTSLPLPARAYILGVLGVTAIVELAWAGLVGIFSGLGDFSAQAFGAADWPTFAALVVIASVAHIFPVSSPEHRQAYHVSLPFFIAAAILLPPAALFLLMFVVHLAEWARRPQRSWFAQAFNLSVYVLSATLARTLYTSLWPLSHSLPIDLSAPDCVAAGLVAAVGFGTLNRTLVSLVIWLGNGVPPSRQQMLFEAESLLTDACMLAMGLPIARLGVDAPWALALGAAPVLLIHRALDLPNIRAQARRDQLTQLATAAAFKDACARELSRARHFGRPLALVVLEIDEFEHIVARHGRSAGDVLLRDVARLLEQAARAYDIPARLDRAGFGLLLPETDPSGARAMVEHVRRTLTERGFDVASSIERLSLSLRAGVAAVQSDAVTVDQLFDLAYSALASGAEHAAPASGVAAPPKPLSLPGRAGAAADSTGAAIAPSSGAATTQDEAHGKRGESSSSVGGATVAGQQQLSRPMLMLLIGVSVGAAMVLVGALPQLAAIDLVALGYFVLLVAVSEGLSLQLFDRSAFSISVAPCLAAGVLFGIPGVAIAAPISAVVRGVYRRTRWYKVLFNASTYLLAGVGSAAIFGTVPALDAEHLPLLVIVAGFAGLAYYAQTLLVAAAMALESRSSLRHTWLEHFRWLWPQYIMLSVMGLFLALGYAQFGILGATVFTLPPLMLRFVSKQYVDRTLDNVRQLRELNAQLTHQAFHDPLTKLANRARLTDRVEYALGSAARHNQQVVMLFIDLDNFKAVNDSLGHAAGDQLLLSVTERLRTCLRAVDTAARLGGDEFAVVLEDLDEPAAGGIHVAQRILDVLRAPFVLAEKEVFINASIGIALSHPGQTDADELLRNADVAMYAAKEAGKGRFEVFESRLHTAVLRRLALEADLRSAIERHELTLHYQPTVRLPSGGVAGFEALVRWKHPQRGLIPPSEFIASAEASGLIVPIGKWVLEEACQQLSRWRAHLHGGDSLTMSVNLSARQLQEPSLVEDVRHALRAASLDPSRLVLEITESLLMDEADVTVHRLRVLKGLGVRLAIDDFGTGYSSLSYLRRFPVDILKIDRSFVSGVGDGSQDAVLTEAIVMLARTLQLQVVAEGIEQAAQLAFLRELGCDLGQGYYFARPLPVAELEEWLTDRRRLADSPARASLAAA